MQYNTGGAMEYDGTNRLAFNSDGSLASVLAGDTALAYKYDALGRWLTPDPLGTLPNPKQGNRFAPLSQYTDGQNLYEYCAGDPVNERDLRGLVGLSEKLLWLYFLRAGRAILPGIGQLYNQFSDYIEVEDTESEMMAYVSNQVDNYYIKVVKQKYKNSGRWETLSFPLPYPERGWRTGVYVLAETTVVNAYGSIEAKCCKQKCWVRNRDVSWVWIDEVDANSWRELEGKTDSNLERIVESLADFFGDKVCNAEFDVKVWWYDEREGIREFKK